jgi:hypothetical protein
MQKNKIAITIEFTEAEFLKALQSNEKFDMVKFRKVVATKQFARRLARDMKDIWSDGNIDGDPYELISALGLGGSVIEDDDF